MRGIAVTYLVLFLGLLIFVSVFIFFTFFKYRITVQVLDEYYWNRYQDILPLILASSIEYGNKGNIPFQFILSHFIFERSEREILRNFLTSTIGKCFEVEIDGEAFKNMEGCDVKRKLLEDKIKLPLFVKDEKPSFKIAEILIRIYERKVMEATSPVPYIPPSVS